MLTLVSGSKKISISDVLADIIYNIVDGDDDHGGRISYNLTNFWCTEQ